uniref:Uncharacterized protein n=1 Tax=Arundo donax TaxID=35708 RepID=A0A0A9D9W9_ARUDO
MLFCNNLQFLAERKMKGSVMKSDWASIRKSPHWMIGS